MAKGAAVDAFAMPKCECDRVEALRSVATAARLEGDRVVLVLEKVGGFVGRGQPGSSMFKFGSGWGFLRGVAAGLEIPLVLVTPQEWQPRLHLGTASACASKAIWKHRLKDEAGRRYPHLRPTLRTADALLILDWAISTPGVLPGVALENKNQETKESEIA